MMKLTGKVLPIRDIDNSSKETMYNLMVEFYDNMERKVFLKDFNDKNFCIVLYDENGVIKGFSTQKLVSFDLGDTKINGVFSGDTIIHKDNWGSLELFIVFSKFFFEYAKSFENFYWFLICKGYKTYKILPSFFEEFYPRVDKETPNHEKTIIDTYGKLLYKDEYNSQTGVFEYKNIKDKLKEGIATIGEKELKNKDIAYFLNINPGYIKGNDLACLTRLDERALKPKAAKLLFG